MLASNNYFGLCGLGNVGSGLIRLLRRNGSLLEERWDLRPQVKRILVRDPAKPRQVDVSSDLLTTDPWEVVRDPEIGVVVELMGGREPAREIVLEALKRGKSVVTANKELLAYHGREILDAGTAYGADIFFEASVAGGTPIIRPLKYCLAANRILSIRGILNGTTNYILTKMTEEGGDYEECLAEAQQLGYAEADPTDDVEGHDALRKLSILAALAFGTPVKPDEMFMEGISGIKQMDIALAGELGYVIKLIATGRETDGRVEVRVHPTLLPGEHPLAKVNGSLNSILVDANFAGPVTFTGHGAGGDATASAVAADLLEALRNRREGTHSLGCTCWRSLPVLDMKDVVTAHYLRFAAADQPGVLGRLADTFGKHGVNLRSVIQKPADVRDGDEAAEPRRANLVFLTDFCPEKNVRAALKELATQRELCRLENHVRCEES